MEASASMEEEVWAVAKYENPIRKAEKRNSFNIFIVKGMLCIIQYYE
jgi:hypothetical protein